MCWTVLIVLTVIAAACAGMAPESPQRTASVKVRRPIDHERPLIVLYMAAGSGTMVERHWAAIPEALRPYVGLAGVNEEGCLVARKLGIPVVSGLARTSTGEPDKAPEDATLGRHTNVVGVSAYEYGVSQWGPSPCFAYAAETCRKHGAYLFWPFLDAFDYVIEGRWDTSLLTPRYPRLYDFFRQHGGTFIFQAKLNGTHYRDKKHDWESFGEFLHGYEVLTGSWLTGLIENWGIHPENWIWYEKGYTRLFDYSEPVSRERWGVDWHGVIQNACPENLLGQEILTAMLHGCVVVSVEEKLIGRNMGPAYPNSWFEGAYWPVLAEIATRGLIPSREEMRRRVRAASDGSFQRLYGNTACALMHDGRYGVVAWLPSDTPDAERRRFEFLPGGYDFRYLPFLNALYPAEGRGRSFIQRRGRFWCVMNPWENINRDSDFLLHLYTNTCGTLSGTMMPHTWAIVEESRDGLDVFVHNFRLNKDGIWSNRHGCFNNARAIHEVIDKARAAAPTELRRTSLVLTGHAGDTPPKLTVQGHAGFRYEERWEAARQRYEVDLYHNGTVRLQLACAGRETATRPPQALSSNLALDKRVESGSTREGHPAQHAVDGLIRTSWAPAGADSAWIAVDLGEETDVTAYKVVPAGTNAAGPLAFRFETAKDRGGPWIVVHRGGCVDGWLRAYALPQGVRTRFMRLVLENPADGQGVAELGVYKGPAHELETWSALAEPANVNTLLALLPKAASDAERYAVRRALAHACRTAEERSEAVGLVAAAVADAPELQAATLLRVLGDVGDDAALKTVIAAVTDPRSEAREAAEWALADWPTPVALPALLALTRSTADGSAREHAIRSIVRILDRDSGAGQAREESLVEMLPLAAEEKTKLVCLEAIRKHASARVFAAVAGKFGDRDSHKVAARSREIARELAPRIPPEAVRETVQGLLSKNAGNAKFCDGLRREFPDAAGPDK